jgi:hypothetical protein
MQTITRRIRYSQKNEIFELHTSEKYKGYSIDVYKTPEKARYVCCGYEDIDYLYWLIATSPNKTIFSDFESNINFEEDVSEVKEDIDNMIHDWKELCEAIACQVECNTSTEYSYRSDSYYTVVDSKSLSVDRLKEVLERVSFLEIVNKTPEK